MAQRNLHDILTAEGKREPLVLDVMAGTSTAAAAVLQVHLGRREADSQANLSHCPAERILHLPNSRPGSSFVAHSSLLL